MARQEFTGAGGLGLAVISIILRAPGSTWTNESGRSLFLKCRCGRRPRVGLEV